MLKEFVLVDRLHLRGIMFVIPDGGWLQNDGSFEEEVEF